MAHDRNGVALAIGDKVALADGTTFHINGAILDDGTVVGSAKSIAKAKFTARAQDVTLVQEWAQNRKVLGEGCIVWGNGPPDPNAPA